MRYLRNRGTIYTRAVGPRTLQIYITHETPDVTELVRYNDSL